MPTRLAGLLCGGLLLLPVSAANAATATVRVEGASRTLVPSRQVALTGPTVVKDADQSHSCPGGSAAGALERATAGAWTAKWSEGLGYFVDGIRGERHDGSPEFWSVWVDHASAQTGLCQISMKAGEELLLFVDRCDFDAATQGCKGKPVTPLGIMGPRSGRPGSVVTLRVVAYQADGKPSPLAGASILAGPKWRGRTDAHGRFRVRVPRRGSEFLRAAKSGRARSEVLRLQARG